jgi:hypothetical protein
MAWAPDGPGAHARGSCRRRVSARALRLALLALSAALPALGAQTPATSLTDGLRARTIGPAAMSGRFVDLAVLESAPHVFYAASSTGGLWKTTNNGVSFTAQFNDAARTPSAPSR